MDAFRVYLEKIEQALQKGIATEHTYRSALEALIQSFGNQITATNEPKRIAPGAPDLIISNGSATLGYIETKDIGTALDKEERSDQMKRYREGLGNLILTDYLEFRWYALGERRMSAQLARKDKDGQLSLLSNGIEETCELLTHFIEADIPQVSSPRDLARRMAGIARLIKKLTAEALSAKDRNSALFSVMEGIRKVLMHDLQEEQFTDMYAQTICYGLFAAKCNAEPGKPFSREMAAYELSPTNPFLQEMFHAIAGPRMDRDIVWAVNDLVELLNRTDMAGILADFGKHTRQQDPVLHFYETFLAAYDPEMREKRGVYYTPEPVVSYIVRSVDHLLKNDFGIRGGLADDSLIDIPVPEGESETDRHRVQILDPACGTGTFLYSVINRIHESFAGNKGMWSGYVSEHLLPRLYGFELLMGAYTVAHMKLGLQLRETGYDFHSEERLHVYLTNTLEEGFRSADRLPFVEWLVAEANAAGTVKKDAPVMVVLGNPPYSGH